MQVQKSKFPVDLAVNCNDITISERRGRYDRSKLPKSTEPIRYIMKQVVMSLRDTIMDSMEKYSPVEEFGITAEEEAALKAGLEELFSQVVDPEERAFFDIRNFPNSKKEVEAFKKSLKDPKQATIFERHNWKNVKDFYGEMPELADGGQYRFLVSLSREKKENTAFANTLINVLCMRNQGKKVKLTCDVIASEDSENHFWCRAC